MLAVVDHQLNLTITLSNFIYHTFAQSTPTITLHHAFDGPNRDDGVRVDAPTTTVTP
jgi:hypothetical protein